MRPLFDITEGIIEKMEQDRRGRITALGWWFDHRCDAWTHPDVRNDNGGRIPFATVSDVLKHIGN